MQGKAAVITGGASGLGRATAQMMLSRGARVALVDIDQQALRATSAALVRPPDTLIAVRCDVSRRDEALAAFSEAVDALGQITVLVSCAGVYPRVPILAITDEDWSLDFAVNVRGTYNMMVAAVKHMQPHGCGRIVNISSIDAFTAHPDNAHYAATKAAVVSLTRSFAAAFARDGILVNSVAPGPIATEKAKAAGWLPGLEAKLPLGRAAQPEDIAEVIVFLAGDTNRYTTGETVIVSGGSVFA